MRDLSADRELRFFSLNTATLRGQGDLLVILEAAKRLGVSIVAPWRDQVAAVGLDRAVKALRSGGFSLSGYCRGGLFTGDASRRAEIRDDNRRAVDEAKALDATCLVLVVGSLPGALAGAPQSKDLFAARRDVRDGIAATLEYAKSVGMPLAIEPLHPMYAADRACVNTMEQALDLCEALDPRPGEATASDLPAALGVAVDVYHVWWDPKLEAQIARAGRARLHAFHVCDWLVPTRDLLNDRGMMGDGVIEIRRIRAWMEAAGFAGYSEVEIFSSENWWKRPADEVVATCIERHRSAV